MLLGSHQLPWQLGNYASDSDKCVVWLFWFPIKEMSLAFIFSTDTFFSGIIVSAIIVEDVAKPLRYAVLCLRLLDVSLIFADQKDPDIRPRSQLQDGCNNLK